MTIWILLGVALVVGAGAIRRRSLRKRVEQESALREEAGPGPSPAQEIQGAPPELRSR